MHITLNGEAREFPLQTTVVELLETLGYQGKRVAVERNGEIVPKANMAIPCWTMATRSKSSWRWVAAKSRAAHPRAPRRQLEAARRYILLHHPRRRCTHNRFRDQCFFNAQGRKMGLPQLHQGSRRNCSAPAKRRPRPPTS